MQTLSTTIAGILHNMKPAMICMCEVGEAHIPLTDEEMQQVADQTMQAWHDAATEQVELHSMFEVGAPYMTIYDEIKVQCSSHRILKHLYHAQGRSRTAQTFLCCGPGGVTVDIINVHAPSGSPKLNDQQRLQLNTNLLQSNSMSIPGSTIGSARFLIGGDMNTGPFALSGILEKCRKIHVLHTEVQVIEPTFGKHGDVAFLGGFAATCLTTSANNHDPQHIPYGICWVTPQLCDAMSSTEQELPPWPARSRAKAKSATPHRAASSSQPWTIHENRWDKQKTNASVHATEQPLPASTMPAPPTPAPMPAPALPARPYPMPALTNLDSNRLLSPTAYATEQPLPSAPMPAPPAQAPMPAPPLPGSAPATLASNPLLSPTGRATEQPSSVIAKLEELQSKAEQGVICESDVIQELEAMHAQHGNILKPEDFPSTCEEVTEPQTEFATQELSPGLNMVYSIVNEFLGQMTFNNPKAEQLLLTALEDESCLTPLMQQRITEVFSPIFFHYPNGLKDRSVWQPRDTSKYIHQWRELAAWRARIGIDDDDKSTADTEHGKQLSKDETTRIFTLYLKDLKTTLRTEQVGRDWTYYKSCAESKLNRKSGSRLVAYAIWEIGLPRLPSFATEQRGKQLSQQALEDVPAAIHKVLNWLDLLAYAFNQHKSTPEYQTALRKSGVTHGQSGLTATKLETRKTSRKAKFDLQNAKELDKQWTNRELTPHNWKHWQRKLLHAYWDGSLQNNLEEIARLGNADPMCRTPSVLSHCDRAS